MQRHYLRSIVILVLSASMTLLAGFPASAQQAAATAPYSATAIHSRPGQPETSGKIMKSGQNLRMEFAQSGQPVIQILRPADGVMFILNPQTQTYFEVRGQAVPTPADAYTNPCPDQADGPACQLIGKDVVSGINVERWAITLQPQSEPIIILWDSTRRRALRQEFPDGSAMVMAFQAMEEIAGRTTEHWTIELTAPGQEPKNGDWWFDPTLRLVVREDLPNGETRRLEDIVVGQVNEAAFQVPAGWKKTEGPQQPAPSGN